MSHRRIAAGAARVAFVLTVLALCAIRPVSAQTNTISQTTCGGVTGVNSCLANGFLQDLVVDCSVVGPAGQIATALAQITDRNGPNRITVSNTCSVGASIVGFNRLTIQGNGATLTRGWNIVDSRNITLRSLTFDFASTFGMNVTLSGSQVTFDGVTVSNSTNEAAIAVGGSGLGFAGAASLITNNSCVGIRVGAGSQVGVANVTISNNGLGPNCGSQRDGIQVNGGSVNLSNQVNTGGGLVDAPVDISGNGGHGIALGGGALTTSAENGNVNIHIHHNTDTGLEVAAATAELAGHVQLDNNHMNVNDPIFPGPLQIDVAFGGSLFTGDGASVQGGLVFAFNASGIIGDGGSMTITGGAFFIQGSSGLLDGANSIDTLSCDGTSWAFNGDNQSVIGSNTCPSSGPAGTQGPQGIQGPPGAQGPQGIQGAPGVSGREVVVSPLTQTVGKGATIAVAATCPAGKVVVGGGASTTTSTLALTAEGPSSETQWTVQFENTTSKGQSATVTATAICAFAQ
jgi:hypothetical protein